jgi:dTDP-3-amino-2,3,6-trideoxy-4-keto-D-glucose/dTDP-3-amino-3,4,6-trideoxy-alpha-D-glucose/dTDP-2,6-dideoxy-D-kanosamine transaminase
VTVSTERIALNDLKRIAPEQLAEIQSAIARVVASGWFVMGPEHDAFEAELAAYLGVAHVIGLGNGTDALELALAALDIGPGDRVLTIANAGGYATTAIRLLGATPVYADVNEQTLLLDGAGLQAALDRLEKAPAALVVTHLFGAVADMDSIMPIARSHGIPVLEDCAQSLGSELGDRRAGALADIATTSFYPTKNLGAMGDGGAVMTSDDELATRVRRMRQYGWTSKYRIGAEHGRNSRLDELQAAILRVRLPHLDADNERRRDIHRRYEAATPGMVNRASARFNAHLAVMRAVDRDAARASLDLAGVSTDVHYPVPDHLQAFPVVPPESVSLPVTERAADVILSLPMFLGMREDEVERVCAAVSGIETADG